MLDIDAYDREAIAKAFGISPTLAAGIMDINDGYWGSDRTPEWRYAVVKAWLERQIR